VKGFAAKLISKFRRCFFRAMNESFITGCWFPELEVAAAHALAV
jgi:hypothetical protein